MDEKTSLLGSSGTKNDGGATRRRSRTGSFSRFGDGIDRPGVRPSGDSIGNIPQVLEGWHRRSMSAQADSDDRPMARHRKTATTTAPGAGDGGAAGGGLGGHQRARSFMEMADGSMAAFSE